MRRERRDPTVHEDWARKNGGEVRRCADEGGRRGRQRWMGAWETWGRRGEAGRRVMRKRVADVRNSAGRLKGS